MGLTHEHGHVALVCGTRWLNPYPADTLPHTGSPSDCGLSSSKFLLLICLLYLWLLLASYTYKWIWKRRKWNLCMGLKANLLGLGVTSIHKCVRSCPKNTDMGMGRMAVAGDFCGWCSHSWGLLPPVAPGPCMVSSMVHDIWTLDCTGLHFYWHHWFVFVGRCRRHLGSCGSVVVSSKRCPAGGWWF